MKTCNKCNIEKELSEFYKHPKNKDGLDDRCKLCRKEYYKQYYSNNQEKYKEKSKQRYLDNKEYTKQHYLDNQEKYKEKSKQRYLNNKESHKEYYKERNKQYYKQRLQTDILFRFSHNIRCLLSTSFKRKGYWKKSKTEQILECTIEEFKCYLEKQFIYPMSFNNYGSVWEIDHITPISSAKTEEDIVTLNHYTNLRPLFKTTEIAEGYGYNIEGNRNKGNKII
jgi:hypothetical protein